MAKTNYLGRLRAGETLTLREQMAMILQLSLPAILAQISTIIMQYIDASMVGQLGAAKSASIGLAASTTWLFGGICGAAVTGFTVQVAQAIGAEEPRIARDVMRQGFVVVALITAVMAGLGALVSGPLPRWLGGGADIRADSSAYFLIFALSLPVFQLGNLAGGMLQASGNIRLPSVLHVLMCGLDVVFNLVLIFPSRKLGGITLPGADLGVAGAALGTALARLVVGLLLCWALLRRSPMLALRRGEPLRFSKHHLRTALKIAVPQAMESVVANGAQIVSTGIVAPLGTVSIAANSFAVTAESLCYMPGYGIGAAASTIIGQSTGAGRKDLARKRGWLVTGLGMAVMGASAVLLYLFAPLMLRLLSPDPEVVALGVTVLRIVAFAEPMYAASIVAAGVFRGTGDTLASGLLNLGSMWIVRLPLAALLAPRIGLRGVWIAMSVELCVRGGLFLVRLAGKKWQKERL